MDFGKFSKHFAEFHDMFLDKLSPDFFKLCVWMFKWGIKLPFGDDDNADNADDPDPSNAEPEPEPKRAKRERKNQDKKNTEKSAADSSAVKADPDLGGNLDLNQLLADARAAVNKGKQEWISVSLASGFQAKFI